MAFGMEEGFEQFEKVSFFKWEIENKLFDG